MELLRDLTQSSNAAKESNDDDKLGVSISLIDAKMELEDASIEEKDT